MSDQSITAPRTAAQYMADQPMQRPASKQNKIGRFFTAAHYALTLLGLAALFVLGMIFFNPEIADKIATISPFSATSANEVIREEPLLANLNPINPANPAIATPVMIATAAPLSSEDNKIIGTPHQQKRVTAWLSKRYRVANDATNMLVSAVYLSALETKLDPLLILSVIAIESRFNPFAESPMGAQGLMQVMSKIHHDKFQKLGGIKAALNPIANIKVGSLILKEYMARSGSIEAALKMYVGATDKNNDGGYSAKVLSEYQNLQEVAAGQNISIFTTASIKPRPVAPQIMAQEETVTIGKQRAPAATIAAL